MNFQNLKKIENPDHYIDVAFRKASKRTDEIRSKTKGDRLQKSKTLELTRIQVVRDVLYNDLINIVKNFPSLDDMDEFYKQLIRATLDYKDLKKSLGSVNWATQQIDKFFRIYMGKIKKTEDIRKVNQIRKQFYGRVASIVKQIKPYLNYIDECRKTMREYPAVKTSLFTVCIFGFPNSGKSTLLSKITDAEPEVAAYPFTTKTLNLGYIKHPKDKVQIIDTPGTLNRLNKMNKIELQAYLAVKHLAHINVFVFDPQFSFDFSAQKRLLSKLKKFNKPVLLYMSKADIVEKESIDEIKKEFPDIITDAELLKEKLTSLASQHLQNK